MTHLTMSTRKKKNADFVLSLLAFIIALALVTPAGRAFLDKYPQHHFQGHHHNGNTLHQPRHYTFPTIATALIALCSTFLFIVDITIAIAVGKSVKNESGFDYETGLGVSNGTLS